jgi:3-oxoacyl-[acyl-carrier protein] reductase
VRYAKGDPKNPLTNQEIAVKFLRLAERVLGTRGAKMVLGKLWNIEDLKSMREILDLFALQLWHSFAQGRRIVDLRLKGRTALVTGASMGIGRAIAIELAREGVRVALTARRADALQKVAAEVQSAGEAEPVILEGDLYDPKTPERLAREASAALGRVDILINSAGSRPVPWNAPIEAWDEGMKLNYTRLREITHEMLPGMVEQRWGRVINLL